MGCIPSVIKRNKILIDVEEYNEFYRRIMLLDETVFDRKAAIDKFCQMILKVLDCEYYIIHKFNSDDLVKKYYNDHNCEYKTVLNFSNESFMNKCSSEFNKEYNVKSEAFTCDFSFNKYDNIYGDIIRNKKYYISNDEFNNLPEGHPAIKSFIGIPLFKKDSETVAAIMGFANSGRLLTDDDYKSIKKDILIFERLMNF